MVLTRRRLTTATATTPYKPLDEATPAKALLDATNLRKNAPATAPVQRKNVGAPVTAPAQVDGPARRTRSTRKMAPSRKESPVCPTKQGMPTSVRRPRKNETEVVAPAAEDEPVAAASIGQVYKAKLRNGKVVALKVQRPDCERVVALDLFVLRWWARLGTSFFVRARTRRGNSKVTRSS